MGRPKGSRNRVTLEKTAAVKALSEAGVPVKRIAEQLKISRPTVKELRESIADYMAQEAPGVAQDWREAIKAGAKKGLHKPAQDWLTSAGIVEQTQQPSGPQILIGISLPGLPPVQTGIEGRKPLDSLTNQDITVLLSEHAEKTKESA